MPCRKIHMNRVIDLYPMAGCWGNCLMMAILNGNVSKKRDGLKKSNEIVTFKMAFM
ncbi:hypothetical protein SAMN05192559_101150 [Halobacillus karajensis]|nr:hypothetical protein SAMN05192559_101150 [Halobacillus karajensis]